MNEFAKRVSPIWITIFLLMFLSLSACNIHTAEPREVSGNAVAGSPPKEEVADAGVGDIALKVTVTRVKSQDVIINQRYDCPMTSRCSVSVRAVAKGALDSIYWSVRDKSSMRDREAELKVAKDRKAAAKQRSKEMEEDPQELEFADLKMVMSAASFDLMKQDLKSAEAMLAQRPDSRNETLHEARLALSKVNAKLTGTGPSPFDGISFVLHSSQGTLGLEHNMLTIHLVPPDDIPIEQPNKTGAIETDVKTETENKSARADHLKPNRLPRGGQTGTLSIRREQIDALVLPQRATFEIFGKRYVYVIDKQDVAHRSEVDIQDELEDLFIIKSGVVAGDRIVLEGMQQVRDGEKVICERETQDKDENN